MNFKKCVFLLLILAGAHLYATTPTAITPTSGTGTTADPYLIDSLGKLYWIAADDTRWALHYKQTANIDASDTVNWFETSVGTPYYQGWKPIGGNGSVKLFSGSYDGDGNEISDLYIKRPDTPNIGLFGHIDRGAAIQNLKLTSVTVIGARGTGSLVGRVTGDEHTHILNCSAAGGTVTGDGATGGLVGSNNSYFTSPSNQSHHPIIEKSWADIDVSWSKAGGGDKLGGLSGCNQKGRIINCYARGSVTVDNSGNQTDPTPERVGGLAGCILIRGYIINSYSTGSVTINGTVNSVGGFVGSGGTGGSAGNAYGCFWDKDTSGQTSSSPTSGCDGKTTAEMKTQTTFTGWDFVNIWGINSDYPTLIANPPNPSEATWNGGDASDNYTKTDDNWVGDKYPVASEYSMISFAGSTRTTPNFNYTAGSAFNSIFFTDGADSFTLSGNAISLYSLIQNESENIQTIANNISVSTAAEISAKNGDITLAGIMSGAAAVNKSGAETLLLTGINTHNGSIIVSAGIVGGSGSQSSAMSILDGATLAPGTTATGTAGIGDFKVASLSLLNGSFAVIKIIGTTSTQIDKISCSGTLSLPTGNDYTTIIIPEGATLLPNQDYTVINYTTLSGGNADNIEIDQLATFGNTITVSVDSGMVVLHTTPEPGSFLIIGIAAIAMFFRRRS